MTFDSVCKKHYIEIFGSVHTPHENTQKGKTVKAESSNQLFS